MAAGEASTARPRQEKQYDYLLKFLLVGDSDVGKQEILSGLEDGAAESPFCSGSGRTLLSIPRISTTFPRHTEHHTCATVFHDSLSLLDYLPKIELIVYLFSLQDYHYPVRWEAS